MRPPTNFEEEFCGKVPLNQTNLIQPHGVLLVVTIDEHRILQASENAVDIFGVPVNELVSQSLTNFIEGNDGSKLNELLRSHAAGKLPFLFHITQSSYLATIHLQKDYYIIELDVNKRVASDDQSFVSVYQDVKYVIAAVEAATSTEETCRVAARELKRLSGFDKVMVYQFDDGWNGDVIAEEKEEGMDSYLGLKFPASDVPKQARDLYKKTPYRLIPTIDYKPVKLYPVINPKTNAFTDLSDSNLRSVAGVHLEYLRNMKVNASMSTRILKDGELWGLIACHHRTPNYLSYEMCSVFELLSNVITAKINSVQSADLLAYNRQKQGRLHEFVQSIYKHGGLSSTKNILTDLLQADGLAIVLDSHVDAIGETPSRSELEDLVVWLSSNEIREVYQQTSLSSVYEPAEAYTQTASGLLAVPIEYNKRAYILAFRSEAVQHVNWGGNPMQAVQFEADGKKYHPRASFKQWQQVVKNHAEPWREEVLKTAAEVQQVVTSYRLSVQ